MRRASARAPANALFVVAAAESLPPELAGRIAAAGIAFPWGSLLRGLVAPSPAILDGLARLLRSGGTLTALLSVTARDGGEPLGPRSIDRVSYARSGLEVTEWRRATAAEVAASDSSWGKRLGRERTVWRLGARR